MANHSDPTANAAIGAVSREWKNLVKRAISLRATGPEPTREERRLFTGIYRQLLAMPVGELEKIRDRK